MKNQSFALLGLVAMATGFAPTRVSTHIVARATTTTTSTRIFEKISKERRQQLGIGDDEDEYDLGVALAQNTDDFISKVVAGSLIVTILCLLVAGIVIPATTDYGDGICNALLTGGRC